MSDEKGILWIATDREGLCEFNSDKESFISYRHIAGDSTSLSSNTVYSLGIDHLNNIWIGTSGGLNKLIRNKNGTKSFIHYTEEDGLPINTVNAIVEDKYQQLWLTTSAGMARFDPAEGKFSVYTVSDGLQDNEFSVNALFSDKTTGEIYAGGINGYNVFHPGKISNYSFPPVTEDYELESLQQNCQYWRKG